MSEGLPDDETVDLIEPALGQPLGERTGIEAVDAVLEAVQGLRHRPVEEHVAVFEHAHDQLRRALDDVTQA